MEVVIGFAVGYWVGTRQGRQGLHPAFFGSCPPSLDRLTNGPFK